MVIAGRLDIFGILQLPGQLGRSVYQCRKTLGADINLCPLVLQGYQGDFVLGAVAVQASIHL
jgi:hypothetical protein